MQIVEALIMLVVKQRHDHHPGDIRLFQMRDVIGHNGAPETMFGHALGVFDPGHPPAAALDLFEQSRFGEKIDGVHNGFIVLTWRFFSVSRSHSKKSLWRAPR